MVDPATSVAKSRWRGLRIWIPYEGKTLFEDVAPLGFEILRAESPTDLTRGAIVLPFPYSVRLSFVEQALERLRGLWSPALAERARTGAIRLILDGSAEGTELKPRGMTMVYQALSDLGIPAERAFVVTQDRGFAQDHAAFCAAGGVTEPLRVLNYDLWIKRFHTQFEKRGAERFERRREVFQARTQQRGKRFVSLNLMARPTKVLFLLSLLRDGLWDQGHISFHGLRRRIRTDDGAGDVAEMSPRRFLLWMNEQPGFEALTRELAPRIPDLEAKGLTHFAERPNEENRTGRTTPLHPIVHEYENSWFSVITETEMRARPSRITEKAFKSLVSFHPIVVFGNPGALRAIRDLGYATFGEAIDERYDEEDDPRRRFDMAYAEVLRLCRLPEEALWRMERQLAETLEFNAEWGMRRLAAEYRGRIDPQLMEQLFEGLPEA